MKTLEVRQGSGARRVSPKCACAFKTLALVDKYGPKYNPTSNETCAQGPAARFFGCAAPGTSNDDAMDASQDLPSRRTLMK